MEDKKEEWGERSGQNQEKREKNKQFRFSVYSL